MKSLFLCAAMFITYSAVAQSANTISCSTGGTIGPNAAGGNNVGIGVNTPLYKLHVRNIVTADDGILIENTSNRAAMLSLRNTMPGGKLWAIASLGSGIGTTAAGKLGIADLSSSTYRLIIDSIGNVGIGTFNPSNKLEVRTPAFTYGLTHTDSIVTIGTYIGDNRGWIGTKTNHALNFFTNDGIARMSIQTNGKVSMGISDPDITAGKLNGNYKLYVVGGIKADKVLVKAYTAWPDYVFDHQYQLPTLDELQEYIGVHHHLPGLPAAQEIEKEGLDVGAIQSAQMEKIEELTLYIIGLKKEIEELRTLLNQSPLNQSHH